MRFGGGAALLALATAVVALSAAAEAKQFVCDGLYLSFDLDLRMATLVWEGDEASEGPLEGSQDDGYAFTDGVADYRFDLKTHQLTLRFDGAEEEIACAPE